MQHEYDVILILSRGINKDGSLPVQAEARVEKAVELFEQGKASNLMFSGRWSYKAQSSFPKTESQAMAEYAIELGIDKDKIITEEKSMDTLTNLLFAKAILKEHGWKHICIISSVDHTERVKYLSKKVLGPDYTIDIENCKNNLSESELNKQISREKKSFEIVKEHLSNFHDGDDKKIWELVKKTHPAFSNNPTLTKEELMKIMGESKSDYV